MEIWKSLSNLEIVVGNIGDPAYYPHQIISSDFIQFLMSLICDRIYFDVFLFNEFNFN